MISKSKAINLEMRESIKPNFSFIITIIWVIFLNEMINYCMLLIYVLQFIIIWNYSIYTQ